MALFSHLLDLFFPPLCAGCGDVLQNAGEVVCARCCKSFPYTEHPTRADNRVSGLFTDIPKVSQAAALCVYEPESPFYQVIHNMKYHRRPEVGVWLGRNAATRFLEQNQHWFEGIDLIVPVPLHKRRLKSRRYNQSELIADGISQVTGIPVDTNHLMRIVDNPTQTQRTPAERKLNTQGIFLLHNPDDFKNRHLLLVDDIITTGSTLRSAVSQLTPVRGLTVSVLTMGMAGDMKY